MANGAATAQVSAPAPAVEPGTGFSLSRTLAVMRKELRSYYAFPLVYIVSAIFLVIAGYYFYTDLVFFTTMSFSHDLIENYWQLVFSDLRRCLMLTLPFITMRAFAEERKLGTIELLYTYPLRDTEIFWGKFLATIVIFLMMIGLTLLYPAYIYSIHAFPLVPLIAGYVGLLLIGACFLALGLFISSLCESQVVAGVVTLVLLIFLWIINWNEASFATGTIPIMRAFSLFDQFGPFSRGVIDVYHMTYFIFFIAFFAYLTLRSMEARKWTGRK